MIDRAETEQVLLVCCDATRDRPISDSQLSTPLSVLRQGRSPGERPTKRGANRDVTRELT